MKTLALISVLFLLYTPTFAQVVFKSTKYGYSFTIPDGWRIKNKIIMPDTDAKIVDDRGNSFIVTIKLLPTQFKKVSAVKLLATASDEELINIWTPAYNDAYILRRGTTIINGKEFYFAHVSCPFEGRLRLIHKMFMYNFNGNSISIDCASISSMTEETSVYFDVMLSTFKFNK